MADFGAIEPRARRLVVARPVALHRVRRNRDAALAVHVVELRGGRTSPIDGPLDADGDDVVRRRVDLHHGLMT